MKFPKRMHLRLDEEDWKDIQEAKGLSRSISIAQVLRSALHLYLKTLRAEKAKEVG